MRGPLQQVKRDIVSSSMVQIVILAGIALFLVLQLRRVLGTRDGFEPTQDANKPIDSQRSGDRRAFEVIDGGPDQDIADFVDPDSEHGRALSAMKAAEPGFSVGEFAGGAKGAYELILMAFENGDVDTLRDFLSDDVYESFLGAVSAREDQGLTIEANFIGVRETKVVGAAFDPDTSVGEVTMRFVGELTSIVRDSDGTVVEGSDTEVKKQRDIWTFARTMGSDDPNWQLVATAN